MFYHTVPVCRGELSGRVHDPWGTDQSRGPHTQVPLQLPIRQAKARRDQVSLVLSILFVLLFLFLFIDAFDSRTSVVLWWDSLRVINSLSS